MKLKFKSLQNSSFSLDAEPSDTIASVKSKIQSEHGHQATSQKIIFSGKILADGDTVQSCGVSEKDFMVLMVSKPKAAKPAPAVAPAPAPEAAAASSTPADASSTTAPAPSITGSGTEPSAASSATAATSAEITSTPAQPSAATTASASGPAGTSQFLVGSALEEAVNNIVDMGFEKSEVQKAMRASFNNPERAVEYLMTGIPEHLSQPPQPSATQEPLADAQGGAAAATAGATPSTQAAAPSPAPAATNPRAGNLFEAAAAAQAQGAGGQGAGGAGAGLQGLQGMEDDGTGRSVVDLGNPAMLAQLRQLVQQNPAALNPLVQALAQTNPRLASAMADDPEGVLNILASGAAGGGGEGGGGEEGLTLPAMDELNPEDRSAVEQIIAMGIPENKAIEAYLMCGRNVEMAVQYYFENPQDFDD